MYFSGKLLNYFHMNTITTYFLINNTNLGIYILDRCLFVIIWKRHWVQTPLKRYINGKTFAKCIHSNAQLHFYIPHTKESCIKLSKMSLRQISWKKSLERLTGWWLIFHIFISQWMLLQAVVCMCAHKYFYVLWTIEFSDIIVISSRFTI